MRSPQKLGLGPDVVGKRKAHPSQLNHATQSRGSVFSSSSTREHSSNVSVTRTWIKARHSGQESGGSVVVESKAVTGWTLPVPSLMVSPSYVRSSWLHHCIYVLEQAPPNYGLRASSSSGLNPFPVWMELTIPWVRFSALSLIAPKHVACKPLPHCCPCGLCRRSWSVTCLGRIGGNVERLPGGTVKFELGTAFCWASFQFGGYCIREIATGL